MLERFPDLSPRRPRQLERIANTGIRIIAQPSNRLKLGHIDRPALGEHILAHVNVLDVREDERGRVRARLRGGIDDRDGLVESAFHAKRALLDAGRLDVDLCTWSAAARELECKTCTGELSEPAQGPLVQVRWGVDRGGIGEVYKGLADNVDDEASAVLHVGGRVFEVALWGM